MPRKQRRQRWQQPPRPPLPLPLSGSDDQTCQRQRHPWHAADLQQPSAQEGLEGAPGGGGEEGEYAPGAYWAWYSRLAQGVQLAKQAASHPSLLLPSFTPWEHHLAVYSVLP